MMYIYIWSLLIAPQEPFALSVSSIMVVNFPTISCSSSKVVSVYVVHTLLFPEVEKKDSRFNVRGNEAFVSIKDESEPSLQPSQGLLVRKWQQLLVGKPRQWHRGTLCLHRLWYFYDTGSFLLGSANARSYLGPFRFLSPANRGLLIWILGLPATLETHKDAKIGLLWEGKMGITVNKNQIVHVFHKSGARKSYDNC